MAVTLGPAALSSSRATARPLAVPAPPAGRGDPCGAGDRFAVDRRGVLADGALPSEAVTAGVAAASAFVAAGAAGGLRDLGRRTGRGRRRRRLALAERVRAAGGTVVATGGCFDLLHAGHVSVLAGGPRAWATASSSASTPTRRSAG